MILIRNNIIKLKIKWVLETDLIFTHSCCHMQQEDTSPIEGTLGDKALCTGSDADGLLAWGAFHLYTLRCDGGALG